MTDYFRALTESKKLVENAPITRSLIGVLSETKVDESDYKKHLEDKYL